MLCRSSSKLVITLANMALPSLAVPSTGVRPRDDDAICGCSLVIDDAPHCCIPTDIISLSNVEDVPIVIPSDIGFNGELDIAFYLFSCLLLRSPCPWLVVKSVSHCISPGWSKPEDNPSAPSDAMRSSYIVLKLFLAFDLGCSSLGLMLDIIEFLPCLTRGECSLLRLMLLISVLDVPLDNSSSRTLTAERSEVS